MTAPLTEALRPIAAVLDDVARATRISVRLLVGPSRRQQYAVPRFAAIWIARTALGATLNEVGRMLGDRDHSSILHAQARADELRIEDAHFRLLTDQLAAAARARAAKGDVQ